MCFSGTLVSLMQVYYVKDQQLWLIRISAIVGLNVILKWGEKKQKNKTKHGFESCQGNNSHIIFIKIKISYTFCMKPFTNCLTNMYHFMNLPLEDL